MSEARDIVLNSGTRSILKVGFLIRACFILIFVIGSALLGIRLLEDSPLLACIVFGICLVLFLVFFKLLNAAFFKEHLRVTKDTITVVRKTLSNKDQFDFDVDEIRYLGFANQHYT